MQSLTLKPITEVKGDIHLPGSKSLSNRALLLSALSEGSTRIQNLLDCDDTRHMRNALSLLGIKLAEDGGDCLVQGQGGRFSVNTGDRPLRLYLGNAGTAMRPLCASLCLAEQGRYLLYGDQHMHKRPIGHLVDALRKSGGKLDYLENEGFPPLLVRAGDSLIGGNIHMPGNLSSQYLSALLMALPLASRDTTVEVIGEQVSKPYLDMTLAVLHRYSARAEHNRYQQFHIPGNQCFQSPGLFLVEGDASSASYFLAAGAIGGGPVRVHGLTQPSVQGDTGFIDLLEEVGARVEKGSDWVEVSRGEIRAFDLDLNAIPDAAMTAAMLALFADGTCHIRNVYNWRVKETDRLAAMATELRKVGSDVTETHDSITVKPPTRWESQTLNTYDDHRMAMCLSLAALGPVAMTIENPGCVAKTFPDYFRELSRLTGNAQTETTSFSTG